MESQAIVLKDITKSFKIYYDKSQTLRERVLLRRSNKHTRIQVLKNININVSRGEVVGLIGENGCGKSTALKIISRILYPDTGSVQVNGRVSSLLELGAGFHPDLSGRENVYTNAAIFGLSKKETDSRLKSIIDFSELWDFIDNPVRTYSSGMYMRLAFAVAVAETPDILLVDEILAVGDARFQKKCLNRMQEFHDAGSTMIMVSHSPNQLREYCTKGLLLDHGKQIYFGDINKAIEKYDELA